MSIHIRAKIEAFQKKLEVVIISMNRLHSSRITSLLLIRDTMTSKADSKLKSEDLTL
jgi:hypothetical protein